ncbi:MULTISPECIES: adenosylcobinamide-phosphate synthase CbiB [Prosthecochloris]
MMSADLELQLLAAFILDLLLGDPRKLPHPVKSIGFLAVNTEALLRKYREISLRVAGILAVVIVVGGTVVVTSGVLWLCFSVHPLFGVAASIVILYFSFAAEDLARHARAVLTALEQEGLQQAREKVGMMVGRDTVAMDKEDVVRATVESVAENTVDGVTAPLFYALLFGPVGAMTYKAINTLDSMFGYKNERYMDFGWASAKLDDIANYLPARLTVPVVGFAAWLMRLDGHAVFRSVVRTARQHASPNAGFSEAAFAGALGVRLGGPRSYGGIRQTLPYLGIVEDDCTIDTLRKTIRLMVLSAFLFLASGVFIRLTVQGSVT